MIDKTEILAKINEIITDEKGRAITIDSMFIDSELDSLGTMITFITIDSEFHIFNQDEAEDALHTLDIKNLTVRDLVTKCILSITNLSKEQSPEKDM